MEVFWNSAREMARSFAASTRSASTPLSAVARSTAVSSPNAGDGLLSWAKAAAPKASPALGSGLKEKPASSSVPSATRS